MDRLLNLDFGAIGGRIADVVRDPSSNPTIAVLLFAFVTLFVLILLVLAVMVIMSRPEDEEWVEGEDGSVAEGGAASAVLFETPAVPRVRRPAIVSAALAVALIAALWVTTGVITSRPALCLSCHAGSAHAQASRTDPHGAVSCVDCHERGGVVGSVTFMVAPRAIHFVTGIVSAKFSDGYSHPVYSSTCLHCHAQAIAGTLTDTTKGVRVSHTEPLAAGAQCIDCHALTDGTVSARTVGMSPCLRCHDGRTAKSSCNSCHTKDIGAAVTPSASTASGPQDLIGTPNCYACHTPTACDNCHGIRMPHTQEFMQHGHARAAAMDFWFNGGKTCSKCHTATRNSCQRCHGQMPSHGMGPGWADGHQFGDPAGCSGGCHGSKAGPSRPMCFFCHDQAIKPRKTPKPTTTFLLPQPTKP